MGKRIISQRRGKGGAIYRSPSHRHRGPASHPKTEWGDGIVLDIVHCPGHTAPLARIRYGSEDYLVIAASGLRKGQHVSMGKISIDRGNTLPLGRIPESTMVFNVESSPGDGGKFARAAGTAAVIVSHGEKTVLQLPSGKYRSFDPKCRATIGIIAGGGHLEKPFAKAGKKLHAYSSRSKKAFKVRGIAMNPVDHPHGGGSHQHVGTQSTVSANAPPGRKVGRISRKKKRRL